MIPNNSKVYVKKKKKRIELDMDVNLMILKSVLAITCLTIH